MQLRIRTKGCPDFHVEVESASASVAEVKIAATAGCSIDPEAMCIVHRGKVLKDESTLLESGVDGSQPLMIARAPTATAASATAAGQGAKQAGTTDANKLGVLLKGPGGSEHELQAVATDSVSTLRGKAAEACGLKADEIHLIFRGKLLKEDHVTLAACGMNAGDVLRIARRAPTASTPSGVASAAPVPDTAATDGAAGAPMPNAFGGASGLGALLAGAGLDGSALDPAMLAMMERQLAAATRGPATEAPLPVEVRMPREVRAMGQQVRFLVAERQGVDVNSIEEDPALMDHIARTMAAARARGAPVPNPTYFIDHALDRAAQARALGARLDREASGLDPQIEDALLAAESVTSAAAKAPRRLGSAPAPAPDASGSTD